MNAQAKAAILECQVNAASAGHDLGPFEPAEQPPPANEPPPDSNRKLGTLPWEL